MKESEEANQARRLDHVYSQSHGPKLVRELIKELKFHAIMQEFKIRLDVVYKNKYKQFDSAYNT